VDVDAKEDLEYLEFYMEKNDTPLWHYLKEHYKPLDEMGKDSGQ